MSDSVSQYAAFSGLTAAQAGINTASHNVANPSTVGYTRQHVGLSSRIPYHQRFVVVGQGVDVASISRARVAGLDTQVRTSASAHGRLGVLSDLLAGTESVMGEPNTGITNSMSGLWSAFEELTLDPPNPSARRHVISSLGSLATGINGVAEKWELEGKSASNSLSAYVDETNTLLRGVADLNLKILNAGAMAGTQNDLLDQRDVLIDELANIAGVTASTMENGAVRVSLDGLLLVPHAMVTPLSYDPATNEILHSSGTTVAPGGEHAGFQRYLQTELPAFQESSTPLPTNWPTLSTLSMHSVSHRMAALVAPC
jgi:flagellar hook-associated protein 1 FlgK